MLFSSACGCMCMCMRVSVVCGFQADVSESDAFAMFFLPTDLVEELQAVPRAEMFLLQASQVQQQKVSRGEQHKKTVSVKAGQVSQLAGLS